MVGILLVSHSKKLVEGAYELIQQMNHVGVPVEIAGGTQNEDSPIGTDPMIIFEALERIFKNKNYSKGIVVLMDIGSAIMSTQGAIEFFSEEQKKQIHLSTAPIVEGGIVAMCASMTGANIKEVLEQANKSLQAKKEQIL